MDKKLYDFLQKLNVNEECYQYCKDGVLKETLFLSNTKTFYIHLHFDSTIKPELYFAIEEIKAKIRLKAEFDITFANTNYDISFIKSVFSNVILNKYKNNAMMRTLQNIEINLEDNNICFMFDSNFQAHSFVAYKN